VIDGPRVAAQQPTRSGTFLTAETFDKLRTASRHWQQRLDPKTTSDQPTRFVQPRTETSSVSRLRFFASPTVPGQVLASRP
jgi:hypothetical protein